MRRFKKYAIGAAGMLVLVAAVALATGSGSAVAAQITSVFVTNDAAHAVPVAPQGTANVNVTNGSLAVTQQPITDGSTLTRYDCTSGTTGIRLLGQTYMATALSIVGYSFNESQLFLKLGDKYVASIPGVAVGSTEGTPFSHDIALPRPITFDRLDCVGSAYWMIGTVGDSP
jgi:hypothetical protein